MIETKNNIVGSIKPKLNIAGKINKTIEYISPNNQEKSVIPTKEIQEITPDEKYNGLSKVIVDKIPDEYIIPKGEINITENGEVNVADKETAIVNVPEKKLGNKIIIKNGTYNAIDDNLDGYSQVTVETSGVDINDYYDLTKKTSGDFRIYIKQIPMIDTSDYTNMSSMFYSCTSLTTIPQLDTSNVNNMSYMFYRCLSLTEIPIIDTSNVTNMNNMFYYCTSLTAIPKLNTSNVVNMRNMFNSCKLLTTIAQLDTSKVTDMGYMFYSSNNLFSILPLLDTSSVIDVESMFYNCYNLKTLGGFKDLGKAYKTTQSANYSRYTLDLAYSRNLTHDSLMNVINNLYDIASKGIKTQQLILGSTNLAKLTAEEIQIATEKG